MADIESFRDVYRRDHIPARYRGWVHFAFTVSASIAIFVAAVSQIAGLRPSELAIVPLTFLYANLVEYWGHRGPMHHRIRGFGLLFRRHVGHHHRFFTDRAMAFRDARDHHAVLFPPVMIGFFLGILAPPYWALIWWLWSANAAWLGVATAIAYFLNYELLHFAYHCDPRGPVGKVPGVATLRRLHHAHHDPRRMSHRNFNITYPIGDWLFGTLDRSGPVDEAAAGPIAGQSQ